MLTIVCGPACYLIVLYWAPTAQTLNTPALLCEALCGGPQKIREGNKTIVGREEEPESEKDVNELRVFYLFVLFDHYCKFVV